MALGLWTGVGLIVWLVLVLVLPRPAPAASQLSQSTTRDTDPAVAKAREVYGQRCVVCHGANGSGDGPASAGLTPKPRRFTDVQWQASVSDAHIENIIKFGGVAVGKSPAMPSNPDLQSDTHVIMGLRTVVREFNR